jgi:O-acetyl-ADP-ribose deacetylase (regulator of RNase III)
MGAGLARDFKQEYPAMFEAYRTACFLNHFKYKGIFVYTVSPDRKILCLPTKRHWRYNSRLEWVDRALEIVAQTYKDYGITSLAIPAVGCGKGRLEWDQVYNLIKQHLGDSIDLPVTVYLP